MKIALAQLNYHIGNFELNTKKIIETIGKAKAEGASLVVFSELAVCGYPPRDFLQYDYFVSSCQQAISQIVTACEGIAAIVGAPSKNPQPAGKNLFNTAFFLAGGQVKFMQHKTLLPNYDIFDEYRYFEPNRSFGIIEYENQRIALTICEDLWNISPDPLYVANPMEKLAGFNPDIVINIAASPFSYTQHEKRKEVLENNVTRYGIPIVYVNHVGAQTELIFDGGSMAMDRSGKIALQMPFFEEKVSYFDTEQAGLPEETAGSYTRTHLIFDALVMGIKDYFGKMGFSKAILGLSGGIDSALTLVLAGEALGKENVFAVLLPSQFSSEHSVADAIALAENLGCRYEIIPIAPAFHTVSELLKPVFEDRPFNVTEENIQARLRAVILMAISNKFGYILLNTSNKSEAAVGYGTLYGDMCGGLAVLGDVYKTQVYELANYVNRHKEIIPLNTIIKPPSAELRPGQKDSDSLPEYDLLDKILFGYIEQSLSPEQLIAQGCDPALVHRVLKMVNTNEYKRYQSAPILRVSPKAFGMGRRMPVVGKYVS
ncbi:MAG TPA: NAD+ synthase [Bacteroidales bacterium]|nr:NAD+ synthase [Bacteroidales bacterium]HQN15339.1 NAD+ synthase [Bacteroidales bacterium]HQP16279.1 NAD+ synthase [Bacteroidales bacterium]